MSFDVGELAGSLLEAGAQAAATITILEYQKDLYDDIADERIKLMDNAVDRFITTIKHEMGFGTRPNGKPYADHFEDAFGHKPKVAKFVPVPTWDVSKNSAEDSLKGVPAGQRYIDAANRIMEQDSIVRAIVLDGRYLCVEEVTSCTISDLINGFLPVGDVIEIIKDDAERAAMNGRIGNTHNMTFRDLGISKLRAKVGGIKMHYEHLQSLNQNVHRVGDRVSISEFIQTPAQRLGLALTQAQLIQQSLQNEHNMAAAGDPTAMGKLQAKMQEAIMILGTEAQRGNMINQFVPNYAALLAPAIQTVSQALLGPSGNYKTSDATSAQYAAAAHAPPPSQASPYSGKEQITY